VSAAVIGLIAAAGTIPRLAWAQDSPPEETAPAPAEEPAPAEPPMPEAPREERRGTAGAIERAHAAITFSITETADRIDAFFGDDRIQEESNRSYLKLAVQRISDEDGLEVERDFKLKIVLPRLQRRLHLVIQREDETDATDETDGADGAAENVVPRSTTGDLTSALRLMLRATRELNISVDAGVRVRLHPTVFARARYRRSVEFENWAVRFTQNVKWEEKFSESPYQWEEISRLDLERRISPRFFFRTSLQGAWFEGQHGYFVTQGFALVHRIGARRALVYEWNTKARTGRIVETEDDVEIVVDPDRRFRVEETGPKLRYRQTIGWPWFFLEADAERAFRRDLDSDNDFDGVWRFLIKLELQFRNLPETES
jgi:hypothetical protein